MPFINERIQAEDVVRYGIEEIDKMFIVGGTNSRDWTIDRQRNIYLRNVANGREEFSARSTWTLFWKDHLVRVDMENIGTTGPVGGARHGHKRVTHFGLPSHLHDRRDEIISDLREALTAYKDGGIYATATSYTLTLDV